MFASAFLQAQKVTSYRVYAGGFWRLLEFWSDRVKTHMQVCYKFIDPILKEALEKKSLRQATSEKSLNDSEDLEGETLLDHLVNHTEGGCFGTTYYLPPGFIGSADLSVIKDEILNILVAGRDTVSAHLMGKSRSVYLNSCTRSVTDCRNLDICRLDVVSAPQCAP